MYQENDRTKTKHLDFILLDLVGVEISYIIAYWMRNGVRNLYSSGYYAQLGIVLLILNMLVVVCCDSYTGILRRGYLVELKAILKQNSLIALLCLAYLFFTKQSVIYSRLVLFQFWCISCCLLYFSHLLWKNHVRKRLLQNDERIRILLVSRKSDATLYLKKMIEETYRNFKIIGVILWDVNKSEEEILGVPVVADAGDVLEYVKNNVVDSVLLNVDVSDKKIRQIMQKLLEMGVTVHINLEKNSEAYPNQIVETMGGHFVLTTSKLATPISNGGLSLTPPGYFTGSARGGASQYH